MARASTIDTVLAIREAGRVRRCHTLPHEGSYRLSEHCYGMIALYLVLCEDQKLNVIHAITFHDFPERWLGDSPAPTKSERKAEEAQIYRKFGLSYDLVVPADYWWVQGLDKLDLLLWSREEQAAGNRNVEWMIGKLGRWYVHHKDKLPEEIRYVFENYEWRRLGDDIPE